MLSPSLLVCKVCDYCASLEKQTHSLFFQIHSLLQSYEIFFSLYHLHYNFTFVNQRQFSELVVVI